MKTPNPLNRPLAAAPARPDREGFALVAALLVVLVLSVLAVGAAWLATSEKKTTLAESTHLRSVYAADAGSEAGINFIRNSDTPPLGTIEQPVAALEGTQDFSYDTVFRERRPRAGWAREYKDYDYTVAALGQAGTNGQAGVSVIVSRLYKEGY